MFLYNDYVYKWYGSIYVSMYVIGDMYSDCGMHICGYFKVTDKYYIMVHVS